MSKMPTQRPFFSNFLAAFRPHSPQLAKSPPPLSTSAAAAAVATGWVTSVPGQQQNKSPAGAVEASVSSPRPINPKASPYASVATSAAAAQDRQLVASLSPLQHTVSPQTHLPRSPPSPGVPVYGPPNRPQPGYPTYQEVQRSRRGSDSSSDSGGFREVRGGGEKWFIGGLTASGEERYYKLSVIKRERSLDRISADQLSL